MKLKFIKMSNNLDPKYLVYVQNSIVEEKVEEKIKKYLIINNKNNKKCLKKLSQRNKLKHLQFHRF